MDILANKCKLVLPEGLKELMADISREVIRAQPDNICQFIADYLSAMLVTRENLIIADSVYGDICKCGCEADLVTELRNIDMTEEEVAKDIILKYFLKGGVNEYSLMSALAKSISIEKYLPSIQEAIRIAFLRHQRNKDEISIESGGDTVQRAVKHTLTLYQNTEPTKRQKDMMARRIQAAYRAYGVQRHCSTEHKKLEVSSAVHAVLSYHDFTNRTVEFKNPPSSEDDEISSNVDENDQGSTINMKLKSESSICIAGSLMNLPKFVPYSVHGKEMEPIIEPQVIEETEKKNIDYETARRSTDDDVNVELEKKAVQHQTRIEEVLELEEDDDISDEDMTVLSF